MKSRPRPWWIPAGVAGLGLGVWAGAGTPEATVVEFLAVGQGDCTLVRHAGLALLIDVGPRTERFDGGERLVAPHLRRSGISRIDAVILTHPDQDHIGGLGGIGRRIPIDRVMVAEHFKGHPALTKALHDAGLEENRVIWVRDGQHLRIGQAVLTIRVPKYIAEEGDNAGSLFLRLDYGRSRVVWTGDAPIETELAMLPRENWQAELAKAGHHGSAGSTSAAWLDEVRPKWLIVSCGRDNAFGHPAPGPLERAKSVGARVLRTDRDGTIRFALTPTGVQRLTP